MTLSRRYFSYPFTALFGYHCGVWKLSVPPLRRKGWATLDRARTGRGTRLRSSFVRPWPIQSDRFTDHERAVEVGGYGGDDVAPLFFQSLFVPLPCLSRLERHTSVKVRSNWNISTPRFFGAVSIVGQRSNRKFNGTLKGLANATPPTLSNGYWTWIVDIDQRLLCAVNKLRSALENCHLSTPNTY